jgi:hypothetical protein
MQPGGEKVQIRKRRELLTAPNAERREMPNGARCQTARHAEQRRQKRRTEETADRETADRETAKRRAGRPGAVPNKSGLVAPAT